MIYVIGLGSNLDSKYGDQYQTLKKSIDLIKEKEDTGIQKYSLITSIRIIGKVLENV